MERLFSWNYDFWYLLKSELDNRFIIFFKKVNYGGGGYWFFAHSIWNGLTVADLVFPWFIWIMGTSMALSFKNIKSESLTNILRKIFRRAIILFALGLFLNNGYDLEHWRILGVL